MATDLGSALKDVHYPHWFEYNQSFSLPLDLSRRQGVKDIRVWQDLHLEACRANLDSKPMDEPYDLDDLEWTAAMVGEYCPKGFPANHIKHLGQVDEDRIEVKDPWHFS
ncbi:hypothetical protein ElyMa_004635300 [Elysia marginata]|uniref:Uncharacterized protein n=1 Tax=Elysia marginata TaxID=1093978 RepID=A0AAV4I352_9GAST|nr:hypothetical protein ElyMa_004635300 [Elysia marginata]